MGFPGTKGRELEGGHANMPITYHTINAGHIPVLLLCTFITGAQSWLRPALFVHTPPLVCTRGNDWR